MSYEYSALTNSEAVYEFKYQHAVYWWLYENEQ